MVLFKSLPALQNGHQNFQGVDLNLYFDNASTSFPKPQMVSESIKFYLEKVPGSYGRGFTASHKLIAEVFYESRELLTTLFHADKSEKIIITPNATISLNTILFGLDLRNKHVLISQFEHNSVLRPLNHLRQTVGLTYDFLNCDVDGSIILDDLPRQIRKNTSLIIVNHVSNVTGLIQNIHQVKKYVPGLPLVVDAAQSAGLEHIDIEEGQIDYLVFTGHKSLLGPSGIGGFYLKNPASIKPFYYGGTGSFSDSDDMPMFIPDRFEAGTQNITGILGLRASLNYLINQTGHDKKELFELLEFLKKETLFRVYCANYENQTDFTNQQSFLFSITHPHIKTSELANLLYTKYGIITRAGLHCAPTTHKYLGTTPSGTVRISFSSFHTQEEYYFLRKILDEVDKKTRSEICSS